MIQNNCHSKRKYPHSHKSDAMLILKTRNTQYHLKIEIGFRTMVNATDSRVSQMVYGDTKISLCICILYKIHRPIAHCLKPKLNEKQTGYNWCYLCSRSANFFFFICETDEYPCICMGFE